MIKMNDKKCSRCGSKLDLNKFGISNKAPDKHQNYCRECSREYSRLKRAKTPEVTPREVELKEMEILRNENKRLRDRFKILLDLYLNEAVKYD